MYNIAFTAKDVAYKILTFLKAICLKYQVMEKLLNQVINKDFQVSNYVITYLNQPYCPVKKVSCSAFADREISTLIGFPDRGTAHR